jgi:hypothetical protein
MSSANRGPARLRRRERRSAELHTATEACRAKYEAWAELPRSCAVRKEVSWKALLESVVGLKEIVTRGRTLRQCLCSNLDRPQHFSASLADITETQCPDRRKDLAIDMLVWCKTM